MGGGEGVGNIVGEWEVEVEEEVVEEEEEEGRGLGCLRECMARGVAADCSVTAPPPKLTSLGWGKEGTVE